MAFTSVAAAVAFCMDVQYRLLDVNWPHECLKLGFKRRINSEGEAVVAVSEAFRSSVEEKMNGALEVCFLLWSAHLCRSDSLESYDHLQHDLTHTDTRTPSLPQN